MRLRTPDGAMLTLRYQRHQEHPTGDWTWIGTVDEAAPNADQVLLTFGRDAVFGWVAQPGVDSAPLTITTRGGKTFMGSITPQARREHSVLRRRDDALVMSKGTTPATAALSPPTQAHAPGSVAPVADPSIPVNQAIALPELRPAAGQVAASGIHDLPTIDLLMVYTTGVVAELGSRSAAVTRMNFHTDFLNLMLRNSQVRGRVRLVHTQEVTYPDSTDMYEALYDITGRDGAGARPIPASLRSVHANRDRYGADLVVFVRRGGCGGLAWMGGGNQDPIDASDAVGGFSTVHEPGCADGLVIPHEVGHNLGVAHDLETNGGGRPGAYLYANGYRTLEPDGLGIADIMAYTTTHTKYNFYSNPYINVRGVPIGSWNDGNGARTINQTFPLIATYRATKVFDGYRVRNDVNGDGKSDLLFHNFNARQFSFWQMSSSTVQATPVPKTAPANGKMVANGDFNGDGRTDSVWMTATRELWLWRSVGTGWNAYRIDTAGLTTGTNVVGAVDLDGDRKDELLLVGNNRFSYWKLSFVTPLRGTTYTLPAGAQLVATGDLNADGKQDLVWMSASRQLYLWWSNGGDLANLKFAYASIATPLSSGYRVLGAADISGDGKSDLLFHKASTGQFAYWVMNRNLVASSAGRTIGSNVTFAATGDFNADGNAEMVWRRGSELIMWFSDGKSFPSQYRTIARPLSGSWHVMNGGVGG